MPHDPRSELKRACVGFISLLGSSVISAIGFIIIASNRWVAFDPAAAVSLILFVQWQTLGLTIAKTGMEQVVFALVTEDDGAYLDPARYVFRKAAPLAGIFSLAVLFVFSPWAACVAFCTILLDTWSLIIMADLNARQRFKTTALSNLFNYPLFFIVIFALNHASRLDTNVTLAVFLASSALRWLWLWSNRTARAGRREVDCTANVRMGTQQALNYLLFRADQIILAVLGLKMQMDSTVGMYVFLAKFPELVSGVMVVAGTVIFPRMYIRYPFDRQALLGAVRAHSGYIAGYTAAVAAALFAYLALWNGQAIPLYLAVPFLVQSLCIVLANNITYSTLRQGYLQRLLVNLTRAVLAGGVIFLFLQHDFSIRTLSWIVPVQLLLFIGLSLTLGWGRRRELYG